jgi:hypothetical protein
VTGGEELGAAPPLLPDPQQQEQAGVHPVHDTALLQGFLRAWRDSGLCTKVVARINQLVTALKHKAGNVRVLVTGRCACCSSVAHNCCIAACMGKA